MDHIYIQCNCQHHTANVKKTLLSAIMKGIPSNTIEEQVY